MENKITFLSILFTLLFLGSCKTDKMNTYQYADGSGNVYKLGSSETRVLEYFPVQPNESSSGVYSGGEPAKKAISQEQYEAIVKAILSAQQETASHTPNREMMTGQVTIQSGKNSETFILKSGCEPQKAIESALKAGLK